MRCSSGSACACATPLSGSSDSPATTTDAAATEAAGAALAATLQPGDVVLLQGEMGAGKTTFVRGAARALGFEGLVTSPTFTIGRRYEPGVGEAGVTISHIDLHRLSGFDDEDPALLDDYLTPDAIAFVEWPEIAEDAALLPNVKARVRLEHAGGDVRSITVSRT